jgi:hypothetical protein
MMKTHDSENGSSARYSLIAGLPDPGLYVGDEAPDSLNDSIIPKQNYFIAGDALKMSGSRIKSRMAFWSRACP